MDTAQWAQEIGLVKPMEELMGSTSTANSNARPQLMERRVRPQKEQALNCPRCNSTNTKFCYYNNYSLSQPRYFCKTCRRYWTEGGSLRNVPVGGGSRKNKKSSSSSTISTTTSSLSTSTSTTSSTVSSNSSKKLLPPHDHLTTTTTTISQNPKFHEGQDLNLAFSTPTTTNCSTNTSSLSAMDLLRGGISGRGLGPFMPMPMPDAGSVYPSGFGLHEFRSPPIGFTMDGIAGGGGGGGNNGGYGESSGGRLLFPFEDPRQVSSSSANGEIDQQSRGQGVDPPSGFWNGMIGGGGSW